MPDKAGGWRKKIHGKAKDPPPPLALPPRAGDTDIIIPDDFNDRRRRPGWRKNVHGSRPGTPLSGGFTGTADDDVEDARSERSEATTPHRITRPKLSRYLSQFSTIKEAAKEPDFAEPWSEDAPLQLVPPINPLNALQQIYSYMINSPLDRIPLEHSGGIFRIFEDYRKVLNEKEQLTKLLQSMFDDWGKEKEAWVQSEGRYEDEIRRLELLIANGTTGMTGLMNARQGSVVDRKRRRRKSTVINKLATAYENFSQKELDEAIRLKSQKTQLHRPTSPSGKMTALSRHFSQTGSADNLKVGYLPDEDGPATLSRKVKSELDLAQLGRANPRPSVAQSGNPGCSTTGDQLQNEDPGYATVLIDSVLECDAFTSLQDLGTLVARKRGINARKFVDGIMLLLSNAEDGEISVPTATIGNANEGKATLTDSANADTEEMNVSLTPYRMMQSTLSYIQSSSNQKRRKHFSFEPGDDLLGALEYNLDLNQANTRTVSTDLNAQEVLAPLDLSSRPSSRALSADMQKPSKIPSPIQSLGRVRREDSGSSMPSILSRPLSDDHRHSRSSVLTTFRENSRGSLIPVTKSRNGSTHNLHQAEAHPALRVVTNERLSKDTISDTPPGRQRRLSIRHQQRDGI